MSGLNRYQNPEVYDRLAAEYVLGTLKGRARQRFQRLMDERPYLEATVAEWRQRLDPLGERTPEVIPPERVWRAVQRELRSQGRPAAAPRAGFWQSLGFWRLATALSVMLMVATLMLPVQKSEEMPMPQYVAVLEAPNNGPMMVATGTGKPWTLTVALMADMDMPDNEQMRLWCMPKGGGKPIPMGRVTTDKYTVFHLSQEQWDRLDDMDTLAINVEPMGSDEPEPMGPIRYKGHIKTLVKL